MLPGSCAYLKWYFIHPSTSCLALYPIIPIYLTGIIDSPLEGTSSLVVRWEVLQPHYVGSNPKLCEDYLCTCLLIYKI